MKRIARVAGWLAALFVVYALSVGPEYWLAKKTGFNDGWINPLYTPLGCVTRLWTPLDDAEFAYFMFWVDLADDSPPRPPMGVCGVVASPK